MSEKEKRLSENISKLPRELQDKFADQIVGAVMAMDAMAQEGGKETDGDGERGRFL